MGLLLYLFRLEKARAGVSKRDFRENEQEIRHQLLGEELEWEEFEEELDRRVARRIVEDLCLTIT